MSAPTIPVWTWRDAIRKSDAPAMTKHVCNAIAYYLSDIGEGCFPSIKTLMADTSLSNRSLATHIQSAADYGLIEVVRQTGPDGRYRRTLYKPRFPAACTLPKEAARDVREAESGAVQVKEVHMARPSEAASCGRRVQVKEAHAARPSEGASRGPREDFASDRVNLVHHTLEPSKIELPTSPPTPPPSGGSARGSAIDDLIEAVRRPEHGEGIEILIEPILRCRGFEAPDPVFALRRIADWAAKHPAPVLAEACAAVLAKRKVTVKPADIEEAMRRAIDEAKARSRTALGRGAGRVGGDAAVAAQWPALKAALADRIGAPQVASWFGHGAPARLEGGALVFAVPELFLKKWIDQHYADDLTAAARNVYGTAGPARVIVAVVEELAGGAS